MSKMNIEAEGEEAAPYKIYVLGIDRYGKLDQPVEMVAEFWTEEEVRAFKLRADKKYVVYVKGKPVPFHEFWGAKD
jgi:hypothetical protein